MLGPWDPEMPETQPLPFGAHDLVGKQRCALNCSLKPEHGALERGV